MTDTPHTPRDIRRIHGLSERRRLPRLGKIRLGVKKTGAGGSYPAETDFFVVPPEVERVYGKQPTALRIMIPVEDLNQVFPQALKWYTAGGGLRCKGDNQVAVRRWADVDPTLQATMTGHHEPNDLVEIPCPCSLLKTGECSVKGHLMLLLPEVSLSGVYQLDTGSVNNLIEINSSLDFLRGLLGRIAMIPFTLRRVPVELRYDNKKRVHYLLKLTYDGDIASIQRIRETHQQTALPALALPTPDQGLEDALDAHEAVAAPPAAEPLPTPPTNVTPASPPSPPQDPPHVQHPASPPAPTCACGATVTTAVAAYSHQHFGDILCIPCQKKRSPSKRPTTS